MTFIIQEICQIKHQGPVSQCLRKSSSMREPLALWRLTHYNSWLKPHNSCIVAGGPRMAALCQSLRQLCFLFIQAYNRAAVAHSWKPSINLSFDLCAWILSHMHRSVKQNAITSVWMSRTLHAAPRRARRSAPQTSVIHHINFFQMAGKCSHGIWLLSAAPTQPAPRR